MRLFRLERDTDVTGISGTGVVAEGCEFDDGTVALRWRGQWATTVVHDEGIASVHHINGHDGKTRVVWLGYDNQELPEAPEPESTTQRGFGVWAEFKDHYDKNCVVVTSSLATEHCVWVQNEDGNAHLDGDMAVKVRNALNAWLLWVGHPAAHAATPRAVAQ